MNGRNKIVELEENVSYFGATHSDWLYSAMCMEEISFFCIHTPIRKEEEEQY
jgi:hypothetical protein